MSKGSKIALDLALRYGQISESHHKAWVIDQIVRALLGCAFDKDLNCIKDSSAYLTFVQNATDDDYDWYTGIAP